jgi:hypothetical protein
MFNHQNIVRDNAYGNRTTKASRHVGTPVNERTHQADSQITLDGNGRGSGAGGDGAKRRLACGQSRRRTILTNATLCPVRRPSPARATILDVIGDLLADACQVDEFLLDEGIFGLLGKLPIHGRLLPKIVIPVHDSSRFGHSRKTTECLACFGIDLNQMRARGLGVYFHDELARLCTDAVRYTVAGTVQEFLEGLAGVTGKPT